MLGYIVVGNAIGLWSVMIYGYWHMSRLNKITDDIPELVTGIWEAHHTNDPAAFNQLMARLLAIETQMDDIYNYNRFLSHIGCTRRLYTLVKEQIAEAKKLC